MFYLNDGTICRIELDNGFIETEKLNKDGSNKNRFYMAGDPIEAFERNMAGFIRSDIARIKEQQDMTVAQNMLNRLQVIEPFNPNAGKSDAEIILQHRSKYCQTPSEMTRYIEFQLEQRDLEVKAAQPNSETIQFNESDSNDVVDKV